MRHLLPNISILLLSDAALAQALALALYNGVLRDPYYFEGIGIQNIQILELDFISRFPYLFLNGFILFYFICFVLFFFIDFAWNNILYCSCRRKLTDTN
jgi:hypothetical protein